MLRTAMLIFSGNAFGSLMLLIRNLAIARLISVENYGIAATFAITMSITEMMTGLGLQQLIIQNEKGDDPNLQRGLHGFNVIRGITSATLLFFISNPIAKFLGVPELAWAYQVLALIPLIRGFEHFDIYRFNRKMTFKPQILTKTIPSIISLLSIWPLYALFQDYQVMLYSGLIQWTFTTVISHLVSERPYSILIQKSVTRLALGFGWPIFINNILLFLIFQGDKIIVGRELGMEALAIFSMGVTLTLTPTLVSAATERQFFLPQLTNCRDDIEFQNLAYVAIQTSLISGCLFVTVIALSSQPLISFLLNEKYSALSTSLVWFAIWQAARVFKVGGTIVALSKANTGNAMLANCVRILALPPSWYAAKNGGEIEVIVFIATIGELCAYGVSLALVRIRLKISLLPILPSILAAVIYISIILLNGIFLNNKINIFIISPFGAACILLASNRFRSYVLKNFHLHPRNK